MSIIFLQVLPFFMIIGLGFVAIKARAIPKEATGFLSTYVFYFALSAMIFRFASNLSFDEFWNNQLAAAYLLACLIAYLFTFYVAKRREGGIGIAAIEAQTSIIGNVGFMGIPMLSLIFGQAALGPVLLVLAIDLIVFSSLVVILLTIHLEGGVRRETFLRIFASVIKNPMILSMVLGLSWGHSGFLMPKAIEEFIALLGDASTPTALFVIGMSLAGHGATKFKISLWLSSVKLLFFPILVALLTLFVFPTDPFVSAVLIAASAMPTAGNVFLIAQNFETAIERASSTIFVSTIFSTITLTLWILFAKLQVLP